MDCPRTGSLCLGDRQCIEKTFGHCAKSRQTSTLARRGSPRLRTSHLTGRLGLCKGCACEERFVGQDGRGQAAMERGDVAGKATRKNASRVADRNRATARPSAIHRCGNSLFRGTPFPAPDIMGAESQNHPRTYIEIRITNGAHQRPARGKSRSPTTEGVGTDFDSFRVEGRHMGRYVIPQAMRITTDEGIKDRGFNTQHYSWCDQVSNPAGRDCR